MKINSWIIYWSKHSHVLILINISFKSIFSLRIMWIKCFSSLPFRKTSLRERVQIRSFFWSVFSCIQSGQISVFSLNTGKYGPEKTPYLDTFHAVSISVNTSYSNLIAFWATNFHFAFCLLYFLSSTGVHP